MHSWQECSKKPNSATTFVEPVYSDRGVHMEHFVFCLFSKLIAIGIWGSMQTQIVSEAHVILKWKMMSSLYRTYCTLQALSFINVAAPLLKKKKNPVHSTTLGKPASLSNGGTSQRFCEAKGEKYVICHFRFFHIQFNARITPVEMWNWHNVYIPSSPLWSSVQ